MGRNHSSFVLSSTAKGHTRLGDLGVEKALSHLDADSLP